MSLVSICIPTYNRPDYLLKALNSCLKQTFTDFEIIVSDNSENDNSEQVIQQINHPKIVYHRNTKNIGSFLNFSNLLNMANGKYIKYLMDDDILAENCLEQMVNVFEKNPTVGVVMSPLSIINEVDKVIHPIFYSLKKMNFLYRYRDNSELIHKKIIMKDYLTSRYPCCVPTGVMYRKECFERLGGFDGEAKFAVDVEICMRFALEYDFYYVHQVLASWRYNSQSDTVNLHSTGMDISVFYFLIVKYVNDIRTKELFDENEWSNVVRDSYLFASRRSLLTVLAAIKLLNFSIIISTLKTIFKLDLYILNIFKLPFVALIDLKECLLSWFQSEEL